MAKYIDMRALCTTQMKNFCEIQGIGNDPIYMRADSVYSIVKRYISKEYQTFLTRPEYSAEDDSIVWYSHNWIDTPRRITDLYGEEKRKYEDLYNSVLSHYQEVKERLHGDALAILNAALKNINKEFTFCYDNKVVCVGWGMKLRDTVYNPKGCVVFNFSQTKGYTIVFDCGDGADFANPNDRIIRRKENAELVTGDIPKLISKEGYKFIGWTPQVQGTIVKSDLVFHAQYEHQQELSEEAETLVQPIEEETPTLEEAYPEHYNVSFVTGEFGTANGDTYLSLPANTRITSEMIPTVLPTKGYTFAGWDITPLNYIVTKDTVFTAKYQSISWLNRLWIWLTHLGCLGWLLLFLLLLFLSWLLSWLMPSCCGYSWNHWHHPIEDREMRYDVNAHTDTVYIREDVHEKNIDDSTGISNEVQSRGGNVNAFMRFSVIWNEQGSDIVDLDAHAVQPDNVEISYNTYKGEPTAMSGELDVDDIRPTNVGVENIVWTDPSKVADGTYTLFIRNYDGGDNTGAKAEVVFNGKLWTYDIPHPIIKGQDIPIAQIKIYNHGRNYSIHSSRYLQKGGIDL